MSKFLDYVKKIELSSLITESSNTFSYNLPENRKQRLFDFYSFSSLSPLVNDIQSSELRVVKSFAPKKNEQGEASDDSMEETTSFRGARKLNENFVDSFWKAHDKCYVELAKEMLMDIFYCISAEFVHINQDSKYNSEETINKMPEDLREIYKNYLSNDSGLKDVKVPEKKGEVGNTEYNKRYEKAVRSISMAGKSIFDFAKLCSYVYDNFKFSGSYGGPPWSDAANAFIGVANALPEKYRSANIFKPLEDLEDLKDSTEVKAASKDVSKKTEYNFDVNIFFGKLNQATKEQKKEIKDIIAEIVKHFSPHDSTKSWKIVNKTTKEDIIPLELKVNQINGKYLFNLLVNHDNFEGYFDNKFSDAITNRFKEFLDPHKETLNKVFGKSEGKVLEKDIDKVFTKNKKIDDYDKFNEIKKNSASYENEAITDLLFDLEDYLKKQDISNFTITNKKTQGLIIGEDAITGEIEPINIKNISILILNYNNYVIIPNDSKTNVLSVLKNIEELFHKNKPVLDKLFGKKETEEKPQKSEDMNDEISYDNKLLTYINKSLQEHKIKKLNYSSDILTELQRIIINDSFNKYNEFIYYYFLYLKNIKNDVKSANKLDILVKEIRSIIVNYKETHKESEFSKKFEKSNKISELVSFFIIYKSYTYTIDIIDTLSNLITEDFDASFYKEILDKLKEYESLLEPIEKSLESEDSSDKKEIEEDAEEETESIPQTKSSGSYELTPKERLALFVAIDHTWGLSHNTGPTFNKLQEFTKLSNDGRGMWLIDSLDKRTKDENLFRFINKNTKKSDVSPQIASLIKRIVYSYYGATNEEELYQYVAKTNPKKTVPIHVSNTVYRYIKSNPTSNIYGKNEYFGSPYDIEFNSHYNYWCSMTFKIEYKPLGTECIIAVHVTDHNLTILASDKKDFTFNRDGIQSSGEYVESKNSFTVKNKDDADSIIAAYKTTLNSLTRKIVKYEGVRIDPDYTSVLSELEMGYDEFKQNINLNSDISLRRITEYGDDLKLANSNVKFQIGDEGLDFIMPHVVMTFLNAERPEETPDVTYGTPDSEEYFAGKRKKPKATPATPKIRFSFLTKPEISKTFQFTDDVSTNMKNVIYGYISKINETGDEALKRLQKSAVEDFQLGTTKIENILDKPSIFEEKIPKKYESIFQAAYMNDNDSTVVLGGENHNYNISIGVDKGRLTNPYYVVLKKGNESITDKSYRYDSIETIEKNFTIIVEDMISNIKDSEKQEFQNLFKSARSNFFSTFEGQIHNYINKLAVKTDLSTEDYYKIQRVLTEIDESNIDVVTKKHPILSITTLLNSIVLLFSGNDNKFSTIKKLKLKLDKPEAELQFFIDDTDQHFNIRTIQDRAYLKIGNNVNGYTREIPIIESDIKKIKEFINKVISSQATTQQTTPASSEAPTNTIGIKSLSQKYSDHVTDKYPNYSSAVTNYCINLLEKVAVSINQNPQPLIQFFDQLTVLFKYFYDEIDSKLIDEPNFEKAELQEDRLKILFKPISNFKLYVVIQSYDNYVFVICSDVKSNKMIINDSANLVNKQEMVNLAILVNKEYDKMVAQRGTSTQTSQSSTTQTNTNSGLSISDITSDYSEFLNKNYPNIKYGPEREFYLIAISSFAKQEIAKKQGNLVKEYYNHFTKVIKFIYKGIISKIINNNDLAKLESNIFGNYATIKFNLKFPLIFKFFSDKKNNEYVSIELLKKTPAINTSDFFFHDMITFEDLNSNKLYILGDKITDAFSSTENQNLNDSINLKELFKSFLLKC